MWIIKYKDNSGYYYSEPKSSRLALIFDLVEQGFDRTTKDVYNYKEYVTAELVHL
nr:MAG TPA: hypothetical protein [Caudoviricetes sp.]